MRAVRTTKTRETEIDIVIPATCRLDTVDFAVIARAAIEAVETMEQPEFRPTFLAIRQEQDIVLTLGHVSSPAYALQELTDAGYEEELHASFRRRLAELTGRVPA